MPIPTSRTLTVVLIVTMFAAPITYWSRQDPAGCAVVLRILSPALIVLCLIFWVLSLAPGRTYARPTHANARGDTVLSIPSALAPLLSCPEYAPLVETQVRNGGIPVPIPGDLLPVILQINDEYLRGEDNKENQKSVKKFMAAVFIATHPGQEDYVLGATGFGADKC